MYLQNIVVLLTMSLWKGGVKVMWDSYQDFSLGSCRRIELKDNSLIIDTSYPCVICKNITYTLEFRHIDNHICMECLCEVIGLVKFYSNLEKPILKSSENLENNS